jgi:hypothetical protein
MSRLNTGVRRDQLWTDVAVPALWSPNARNSDHPRNTPEAVLGLDDFDASAQELARIVSLCRHIREGRRQRAR